MQEHQKYLQQCITLALKGLGKVSPNPLVGSILVYKNKIIGKGYHQKYGGAHAEVNCIQSVKQEDRQYIKEATLYVNLEPCNHYGNTPPCTKFIIQHKIKKVVIGCADMNKTVIGSGLQLLKKNNIEIIYPCLEEKSIELNKRFFTYHTLQRPYIILKWAQSIEGNIAPQNKLRTQLSNDISNKLVHTWRSQEDAIWVGYNTALMDNPQLNVRHTKGRNPIRIVYDKNNTLPQSHHLLDNNQSTWIFNNEENKNENQTTWIKINEIDAINQILTYLYQHQILSVIVEGGKLLLEKLIQKNTWDEARIIKTKTKLPQGIPSPILNHELFIHELHCEEDKIEIYKNRNTSTSII